MGSGVSGNKHCTDSHSVKEDDLLHCASIHLNQCFLFFLKRTVPRMSKKSLDTRCILRLDVGSVVINPPGFAGDVGSIPGSGRSPGEGNGNPVQYSCLGNPMDGGARWATFYRVTKD